VSYAVLLLSITTPASGNSCLAGGAHEMVQARLPLLELGGQADDLLDPRLVDRQWTAMRNHAGLLPRRFSELRQDSVKKTALRKG
jgi:hypothetical protein